ncbi:MAG: hypothetical protein NTY35_15920 [Planctomycetota bacterium]|nr:hypothetical protein [Planctomycetota bacterium]
MPSPKSAAFLALVSIAGAVPSNAQGLVQLTLAGEIDRTGGARAEVELTIANASTNGEPRTLAFSLFLAERTSAADLAVLLERRLTAAGVRTVNASEGQAARPVTCLFVDDVLGVGLRLGQGLRASVTLSEDRPESVRVLPPQDAKQDAELRVTASTWWAHDRTHHRVELESRLEAAQPVIRIAESLASQATRAGWDSEVQRHEYWMPSATAAGGSIDAVNFDLQSSGDWRLEIALVPRLQQR